MKFVKTTFNVKVNEGTLTNPFPSITEVKIAGTATTAYTYDAETHTITFNDAPADGAAIAVTCNRRTGLIFASA